MAKFLLSTKSDTPAVPDFPVKCVACENSHNGDLQKAIDDGWHISVYETIYGHKQFAGCPVHYKEWDKESLSFFKSVTN